MAEMLVGGITHNALTLTDFGWPDFGEASPTEVFQALETDSKLVNSGDLSRIEAVLSSQVAALNAIFGTMARRAALNMSQHLDAAERYLRIGLRAQNQCRATAETLARIKQGPPIFAEQANVAHGPQQVNNNMLAPSQRTVANAAIQQPELMDFSDGERLDTGATGTSSRVDPTLAAVGAKYRPTDTLG
jgi:hypothetical protein